jgi:hypothetical protein
MFAIAFLFVRDDGLKPKSWCCAINSTSCSSARRVGYI